MKSVVCPVRVTALRDPDSVAISLPEGDITFRELDERVSSVAENLRESGLSGRRVGVYLEKGTGQIVLVFALIRCGSVAVQISTRVPPVSLPQMLLRAGCEVLVTADRRAEKAASDAGIRTPGADVLTARSPGSVADDEPRISLSQPATVVFTSGSTGTPKAALHTFGSHYASALGSARNIPLASGDVWLHSLPLFHVGGLSILFRCIIAGATVALPGDGESIGEAVPRSGATHVSLVATQLRRMLSGDADLSGVEAILLGGSGIPEDLLDEAHARKLPVHTSYGLTEMASQVTTTAPGASREELATSGRILSGRELRISSEGEILVRGETLFAGYVSEGETTSPLDEDGWFHTKDLGALGADGLLTVTGRLDNQFVSGGENIQPEEVEAALRRLSGVEEAVVVPVADGEFGERPVAFVRGGVPEDAASLLRATLPGFKVPVAFHEWPEDAPAGMKVDREFFRTRAASRGQAPRRTRYRGG